MTSQVCRQNRASWNGRIYRTGRPNNETSEGVYRERFAFEQGFESPEFQAQIKQHPPGTEVSAFIFQRLAVGGMCLG